MKGRCSRCKRKVKTRKVYSYRLCEDCWKDSSDMVKEAYPVWKGGKDVSQEEGAGGEGKGSKG